MTTYSNPRMEAEIDGWPYGRNDRTKAQFVIQTHSPSGKQRATRRTLNPKTGRWSPWKLTTYYAQARIVDGDDGRTYIIRDWGHGINVLKGTMQHEHEHASALNNPERFAELKALFNTPITELVGTQQ